MLRAGRAERVSKDHGGAGRARAPAPASKGCFRPAASVKEGPALVAQRLRVQVEGALVGHAHMQRHVLGVKHVRHGLVCGQPPDGELLRLYKKPAGKGAQRGAARAAIMRRVAKPSLRCVRATASEVMWPCTSAASSSLTGGSGHSWFGQSRQAQRRSAGTGSAGAHLCQDIADNLAVVVLGDVQQLRPR